MPDTPPTPAATTAPPSISLDAGELKVEVDLGRNLNLAMAHNAVPLVQRIRLTNRTTTALASLVVRLEIRPAISEAWEARIDLLGANGTYNLDAPHVPLRLDRIANAQEREAAQLWVEVLRGADPILRQCHPLELLAYNEWNGRGTLPQLLAAFVQPNHPAVGQVLARAKETLQRQTGDPALAGYQTRDPQRVRAIAAALYAAVQELEVTYANPPASFEDAGQKIRTPEQVIGERVGTCLDLTVLLAACFEQVGLNPWMVLVKGHAFPGVWLSEQSLPYSCTDDQLQLLKIGELDGICFFDASAMVARPRVPFAQAERTARACLEAADTFCCAIDVRAARTERILPLPCRYTKDGVTVVEPSSPAPGAQPAPAPVASPRPPQPAPASDLPSRLSRWKERLLDISLRNRLLNLRETKKTIALECPDLASFEDALALGRGFRLLPKAEVLGASDPRDVRILDSKTGQDTRRAFLLEQLNAHRLHTTLTEAELDRRQLEISREARLSLEESGVNTLYLAIGCLVWYESPTADQPRIAPLILVPVEVARRSARDPFELQRIDEETRVNVTLLEKLRKDHAIEIPELADEIPQDDAGVDVPLILRLFRAAVLNLPRWRIEERAYLGHFSFTKLLMWHDLDKGAEALLKNEVIRHLAIGASAFPGQGALPAAERLDEERHPATTFCPLDADSTQLAAVFAAEQGKTFVLEGPPGTGKSQTITNLISQCLAGGQTVLFVSEKMAALDVVHRRLEAVGLGEFCLELHSNKARKREVLERLGRSWQALGSKDSADWEQQADELQRARATLNAYVSALHRRHPIGLSVFQGISQLVGLRAAPRVALRLDPKADFSREQLRSWEEATARAQAAAEPLGPVHLSPLRAIRHADFSPAWQESALAAMRKLGDAADELARRAPACAKILQADDYPMSAVELADHRKLAELLLRSPAPSSALLKDGDWAATREQALGWISHGRKRDELASSLAERYQTAPLLALDLRALQAKLRRWAAAFFLLAFFALFFTRRAIRRVLCSGAALPPNRQLAADVDRAAELHDEERYLAGIDERARATLGSHWTSERGPRRWDALTSLVQWVGDFREAMRAFLARRKHAELDEGQRERLRLLAGEESSVQVQGSEARQSLELFVQAHDRLVERRAEVVKVLALDEVLAFGDASEPAHLERVRERARAWAAASGQLRDWCHYVRMRTAAAATGLDPLLAAHAAGTISTTELGNACRRSILELWVDARVRSDPALASFHSTEHTRLIRKFVELDTSVRTTAQEVVRARLAQRMPDPQSGAVAQSELGILMRELQKKKSHLPIRKLFSRIPTLLRRLKPCLLMSPLSVAQYLGTDYASFDLVVFDEASQIPTYDAIGAIGRGRQLVVVGDPKQLPPTSFFNRLGEDETAADENDIDELESILDECMAAGLPRMRLGWHYRSRHESLITFSNYHYYDNGLHTFPAATESREQLGVRWHPVPNGCYDKSKSRTNRAEAEAVVAEVLGRLLDPELQKLSIGIVTFSLAQQKLIEDLLDETRRQHPEIEPFFGAEVEEPLFVKNLENVQGDERDAMLFSVCYGPDRDGLVSMNFGPLNRTGGERRLNVAVTRARCQLVVFSTLTPDKIDLGRTRAVGVRHLKTFLDYAARGPQAIAEAAAPGNQGDFDSPFEAAVHRALVERGWDVHCQVGCSSYRIDLGVVHPEKPGQYLLGIECDGANYHSAKCARDRDRLREAVLRGLGWQLHRIWSSDWWHDPRRELEKIEEALQRAKQELRVAAPSGAWSTRRAPAPAAVQDTRPAKEPQREIFARVAQTSVTPRAGVPYPEIPAASWRGAPDDFYLSHMEHKVREEIRRVIAREAPLHIQVLARRVLACFDLKRATTRAMGRLEELLAREQVFIVDGFIWLRAEDRETYDTFRYPAGRPEQQRKLQEIAPEELANAALAILQQNISLPMEDLARETSRLLGFARTGKQIEAGMADGIRVLAARGRCTVENGLVKLVG